MLKSLRILAVLVAVSFPFGLHAQMTVAVAPWDLEVTVGDTFELEYWVGNLGDYAAPSLASFDLRMDFDEAYVTYNGATVGDMLGDVGAGEAVATITPGSGQVGVTETSLLSPAELIALQPWSFVVFRVSFTAETVGETFFEPVVLSVVDENGQNIELELGALGNVFIRQQQAVPTLSSWGIGGLIAALLLTGFIILRRNGLTSTPHG